MIFSLGLVDAQVFLVAMHDAIKSDREEFNKFRKNVREREERVSKVCSILLGRSPS